MVWSALILPSLCSGFCTAPSQVYEGQYHLADARQIAGMVEGRYLPVFSGGKYMQVADTYDNILVAEIMLPGLPVDGVVDPEDGITGWCLIKSAGLVKFDMSSPDPSLWRISESREIPGLLCAVDAGTGGVVAAGVVVSDGMEVYLFDKGNLDSIQETITIREPGIISDIMVTDLGLYILLEAAGRVMLFDTRDGSLKAEADAGAMPVAFALDAERGQLLIANPGSETLTVLDAASLTLKKTINDPNLMSEPVTIEVAKESAYIGCGGTRPGLVSLDLNDLVLNGKGASFSRAPSDLFYFREEGAIYLADSSGLSYLFDDVCLRIKTRTGQGAWTSSLEVLVAPGDQFGVRVEGGTPPFDLPLTGSVESRLDSDDDSGRSFICSASHEGDYPLMVTDGSGNTRMLMVRVAAPLQVSPSGVLQTTIAGDPVVLTASGGFSPLTWQASQGMLSSTSGRTIVYFPPHAACDDLITVRDRTGAALYTTIEVTVPGMALTPAQRVLLPGETASFTLVGSPSAGCSWQATGGEVTGDAFQGQYTAPMETGEYQIVAVNDGDPSETAMAKVFVVRDQLTITPGKVVLGRQEGAAFMVSGGKGPYTWNAERGDLSASMGSSVVYTASKVSSKTRLSVVDTGGRIASAEIEIQGDFRISPVVSVVKPGEEIRFALPGAVGTPVWQAEAGIFLDKSGEGAIYEAPPLPGTFDLLAMDGRGYQAWARVYVVDESLVLTSGGDTAEAGDTVILSVEGGMGPYSWTASQGLLSTPSGRAVTWIAPPGDNDPDSGKKVLITVTDSMDSVAAREITLEGPEALPMLADPASLSIPLDNKGLITVTGDAFFKASSSDPGVASCSITGNQVEVSAESLGSAVITITGSGGSVIEVPVTVTQRILAVLVAGSGPYGGNALWDHTLACVTHAYRVLLAQGYTHETILLLSADPGHKLDIDGDGIFNEVDAEATNARLRAGITNWALDARELFIYMTGHGSSGQFRINETELLDAGDLAQWISQLSATITGNPVLLYDACRSGSFLSAFQDLPLIAIASAEEDEQAYFTSMGDLSFSAFFFNRIFNGANVQDAFILARNAIEFTYTRQHPLLDDNGNGLGNDDGDGSLAAAAIIGSGRAAAADVPTIGSVFPPISLNELSTARIYGDNILSGEPLARVWAVITPPENAAANPDDPVLDLPVVDLIQETETRYSASWDGFHASGTYNVAIFARDAAGSVSLPVHSSVVKRDDTGYPFVTDTLEIIFPCVQLGEDRFGFSMEYLSGLTWTLNPGSLVETAGEGSCIQVKDDLKLNLSCCELMDGSLYHFSLTHAGGLSWLLDIDSLGVVHTAD